MNVREVFGGLAIVVVSTITAYLIVRTLQTMFP